MPVNLEALGLDQEQTEENNLARRLAKQLTAGKSRDDLIRLAGLVMRNQAEYEQDDTAPRAEGMPQTPDELWDYIVRRYGVRIARVSVCPDHDTPFDYVCAGFFEWYPNVFGIGPRGGGKSYDQALLHDLNSHWKPGCESATFGAVEEQAKRVYAAFKTFTDLDEILGKMQISETNYKPVGDMNYGSKVEVLGGCLPKHARVITEDGPQRISELVAKRYSGRVKSYDFEQRRWVWSRVVDWHSNGLTDDWMRMRIDHGQRGTGDVMCTPGHEMVRPSGEKVSLEDMQVGEEVVVCAPRLSAEQEQVMSGMILGDGWLSSQGMPRVHQAEYRQNYIEWIGDAFSEFGPRYGRRESKKTVSVDLCVTRRFRELRQEVYGSGVKRIPDRIWDGLNELGLAVWLMDDGSYVKRPGRGSDGGYWTIATHHFNASERAGVDRFFDRLGIDGAWRCEDVEQDQWIWVSTVEGAQQLNALVGSFIDVSTRQQRGWKRWVGAPISGHSCEAAVPAKIKSIERVKAEYRRYDLSVEGTKNYLTVCGVLVGNTVAAVNGPHPQKAHSDEVEIMRADTWKESRNLASAKTTPDGRHIKAQNYGTSTMKWKGGRVWQILESFKRAKQRAIERYGAGEENRELVDDLVCKTTTFYVLVWCIFEVAAQVPNCRSAPENADLPEWEPGMDRAECKCDCHEIQNGFIEAQDEEGDPLPRTLESECQGRFYRSRGHRTRAEVIQLFLQNDVRTWRAQQLCRDTETEGLYIPSFSRNRHGLARFALDIANGPIYSGTDWGFTDEAAVLWVQYLERPVEALRYDGKTIVLPRGARVAISEITVARKTATELGQLAIMREIKLANVMSISRVPVRRRWADIQGAGDRRDWAKMGLRTARYSTRNFDEHVKEMRGLFDADRFYVVIDEDRFTGMGCPMFAEQIEGWREEDGKESRELPQHVVSGGRYVTYGMHDVYQDSGAQSPEQTEAVRMAAGQGTAPVAKPYHDPEGTQSELAQAGWRSRF